MTEELCEDVRRLIIERVRGAEDLVAAIAVQEWANKTPTHYRVVFWITRNMRDAPGHITFAQPEYIDKSGWRSRKAFIRTEEALLAAIECEIENPDSETEYTGFYTTGLKQPPEIELGCQCTFVRNSLSHSFYLDEGDDEASVHDVAKKMVKWLRLVTHG